MADTKAAAKTAAKSAEKTAAKKPAKKPANKKKPNVFQRLWKYLIACKGELKKITWPTPKQTTKNFLIVLVVIIVMGLFIFALDRGLFALLGLIMDMSNT